MSQLALDGLGPEPPRPVMCVVMCPSCGPIAAIPIEGGPGARWDQAEKWGYIAHKAHDKEVHGEPVQEVSGPDPLGQD